MHSTLFALSYFGRCVTATSWFLSAAWKVVHPREFSLAYGRITSHNLPMAAPAAWCLAVIEVTAGAILLLPAAPRIVAVTVSLALLALMTLTLGRARDLAAGCGCWRMPTQEQPRRVYVVRNSILTAFALSGLPQGTVYPALVILGLAAGGIVSLALMYLPEIRSVWLAGRKLVEVREL